MSSRTRRRDRRSCWHGPMIACLLAVAIGLIIGPAGYAYIELKDFTATAQADGTILVRWVTEFELNTIGFRIYRALDAVGPWVTIVYEEDARSDGESETTYEFVDAEVVAGTTYYYLLEELEYNSDNDTIMPVRYVEWVRQATVGPAGKTPTATATFTASPTATVLPTATVSRTPTATSPGTAGATATPTPTALRTASPTPTALSTATSSSTVGATPTPSRTPVPQATGTVPLATATPVSPAVASPTISPGGVVRTSTPATVPAGRPTGRAGATPAFPTTPRPAPTATPASVALPSGTVTFTPTPAIFAAKAPATAAPALPITPAPGRNGEREIVPTGSNDNRWALVGGTVAILLALSLAGLVLYGRNRHPDGP